MNDAEVLACWREWKQRCAWQRCGEPARAFMLAFAAARFRYFTNRYGSREGGVPVRPPSARDCWHLFETHLCAGRNRSGKAYKEWLFARCGGCRDDPSPRRRKAMPGMFHNRRLLPRTDRRRLCQWLLEWRLDRDLPPVGGEAEPAEPVYTPPGPAARPGQVRLLFPRTAESRTRPLFYAVLREKKDGHWLTVPFSRFAEPALPGELLTGKRSPGLRVLCLWNVRTVGSRALRSSWVAGVLTGLQLRTALQALEALESGEECPPALARRTGPPLLHPGDPRLDYLDAERARWRAAWSFTCEEPKTRRPMTETPGPVLSRAAEPRGDYHGRDPHDRRA